MRLFLPWLTHAEIPLEKGTAMTWNSLTTEERADAKEIVKKLRTAGISESVSQVANEYAAARAWAVGLITLNELCSRTGWQKVTPKAEPKRASVNSGEQPQYVDCGGERMLLVSWRRFQIREHMTGSGEYLRFPLPNGGREITEYITGDWEFTDGNGDRDPQPGDMVYARIKNSTYGGRRGRPGIGAKVEARLAAEMLESVDSYAQRNQIQRAEAVRRLIARGLEAQTD